MNDQSAVARVSLDIEETIRLEPPKTWQDNDRHFTAALSHPWYNVITKLNGLVAYATNDFFRERSYLPALMPDHKLGLLTEILG